MRATGHRRVRCGHSARAPAAEPNGAAGEKIVGAQARYGIAGQQKYQRCSNPADTGRARGPHGHAVNRQLPNLGNQPRRIVFAPDAGAARDEHYICARGKQGLADLVRIVTEPVVGFEQASVAGEETAQHVGIRVVDLILAFHHSGRLHFIAGNENPDTRSLNDGHVGQSQRRQKADILRPQVPAGEQSR